MVSPSPAVYRRLRACQEIAEAAGVMVRCRQQRLGDGDMPSVNLEFLESEFGRSEIAKHAPGYRSGARS
jgi:hypothetical protein